jgi:thiaminase (transcriptional activator TenA)
MASFSDYLRLRAEPIWSAQHTHPFVRGIGSGLLDPEIFGFWLRQDYLFLIDYARLFGAAVQRAPDLASMTTFARLLNEILGREMELHRSYCAEFGITPLDLELEPKAPTTQGYTDFLLRTSATGDYAEILGALLPCMWGYSELGMAIAARGFPDDDRYRRWINVYADPEFEELASWCRDLTDAACDGLPVENLARVERAFITSSRYELAFWEMAWTMETWAV